MKKNTLKLARKFIESQGGFVTTKPLHEPPAQINGIPVTRLSKSETEFNNQIWVSLIPSEGNDSRIWEFSLTTGKIVQSAS